MRSRDPLAANVVQRGYQLWLTTKSRFSPTERQRLFGLTVLIGGVCGLVAVAFHVSIQWVESQTIERAFESRSWILWVILVPTLGALAAGIALRYVPGARGSGIPQVKVAYAIKGKALPLRDSVGKFLIGSIQIGTGSSMGREGPTVQICSGVARGMGRLVGIAPHNLKLLLPVGTAAGIAAAFNAPIAAVTFTIEEIVGTLDQTLLSGVIVAAALAAVVERSILGESPVFSIPSGYGLDHASSLLLYALLGVLAAIVSVVFTDSLLWLRRRFGSSRLPGWLRPMFGGLVTGTIAIGAMLLVHSGGITGGGYHALLDTLSGTKAVEVMLALGACKLVATAFSYSSGGAGGIFAPSLFIGAMLGGAIGALDINLFGHEHGQIGSFALVGMGAVFAGTIRAPITSVLIIIEMTAGYGLTLPLMISNMMAYGLARQLRPLPIYESLLRQDGIALHPEPVTEATLDTHPIDELVDRTPPITFAASAGTIEMLSQIAGAGRQDVFPVLDGEQRLIGIITLHDLATLGSERDLDDLVCACDLMQAPVGIRLGDPIHRALELVKSIDLRALPVVDADGRIIGLVEEAALAYGYLRARTATRAVQLPR